MPWLLMTNHENANKNSWGIFMKGIGLRAKLAMGFGTLLATLILTGSVGYYSSSKVIAAAEAVTFSLQRKEVATAIELGVRKQVQSALRPKWS
jgi:hypothetical protein